MKKKSCAALTAFLLSCVLLTAQNIGTWTLAVEGVKGVTKFTNADAAKLKARTIEMTVTNSRGVSTTAKYTGVLLKDALNAIGAKNAASVTVIADDGFEAVYDAKLFNADDTLLTWAVDGKLIEGGSPLRVDPGQGTGNQHVKNVVKIIVK
jgi:DMSO/TMAO reductase YedYZ molybdopterin-dependent catalytic subunit